MIMNTNAHMKSCVDINADLLSSLPAYFNVLVWIVVYIHLPTGIRSCTVVKVSLNDHPQKLKIVNDYSCKLLFSGHVYILTCL